MRNRVRDLRTRLGWSQNELAKAAGTSQQQIQRIEIGDQSVKLDLAIRLATALKADLTEVFPQAKQALGSSRPHNVADLTQLADNDKKRRALEDAGLDTDSDSWSLVIGLRTGAKVHLPISTEEKNRFRHNLISIEPSAPFFVFDSGHFHVGINLLEIQYVQELWEPDPTISEWATPKFDKTDITVYLRGRAEPLLFSGSPDWEDSSDEEDIGQFESIFQIAQTFIEKYHFFDFLDGDGESVHLRAQDIELLAIPMWLTDKEFIDDELDKDDSESSNIDE